MHRFSCKYKSIVRATVASRTNNLASNTILVEFVPHCAWRTRPGMFILSFSLQWMSEVHPAMTAWIRGTQGSDGSNSAHNGQVAKCNL